MNLINMIIYIALFIIIYNISYIFFIKKSNNLAYTPIILNNNNKEDIKEENGKYDTKEDIKEYDGSDYLKIIKNYSKKLYCLIFNNFDFIKCSNDNYLNGMIPNINK